MRRVRVELVGGKHKEQVEVLPLHAVFRTWERSVFPAFHHLQSALCVCPRKITVLADGSKKNEDAILERLLRSSEKQRRSENARDEKELKKAQKRRQELNNLFAKMYEDRVKGLLDEENYSMLSVKYRTEQQQLDETIKTVSARLEDAKAETDDAKRWVDLIQKYSAIDELTAPLLNELIEKIAVHQWRKDENGKKVWDIEIYYRFVGKID